MNTVQRQLGTRATLGSLAALAIVTAVVLPSAARADLAAERNRMVDEAIVDAGVKDPRVIESMRTTPRHEFMPVARRMYAYYDMAVAIGHKQTISPPFVVAYMTEQLDPQPTDKVLEIGTGSGYQAAVLSPLVADVYTIEIVKPLGLRAARTLRRLKYDNVHAKVGDGYQGWPEHAPFDKIIVTCSPEKVPTALVEQLREGGRMIVPVGERYRQTLYLFEKQDGQLNRVELLPTLFVPMTGQAEANRVVKPDPARPSVYNGGFEEVVDAAPASAAADRDESTDEPQTKPAGWHYQRQLELVAAPDAPQGGQFVTFSNADPGRGAQALQGMPLDGRQVEQLDISLWVKGDDIRPGQTERQLPALGITFYDQNRAEIGYSWVGPWRASFPWEAVRDRVRVPPRTREAIVRIGLGGATGTISFDGIRIQAVP